MENIIAKFDALGYDLVDLDDIVYVNAGPGTGTKNDCTKSCETCSESCSTCGAGCSNGPTK